MIVIFIVLFVHNFSQHFLIDIKFDSAQKKKISMPIINTLSFKSR